jgi:hypothetical protein
VLTFAGELLSNAEGLLRDGLHPTEIADGYAKAGAKALEILDTLVIPGSETLDVRDKTAVSAHRASWAGPPVPENTSMLLALSGRALKWCADGTARDQGANKRRQTSRH